MNTRSSLVRKASWLAAAALLAVSVFAPASVSAGRKVLTGSGDCAGVSWSWNRPAGENPYPMLSVTVKFDEDPGDCSLDFSMASYDTEGPTWPTSGKQTLRDYDTGTIDADNMSLTLSVAEPECFGQTDFYGQATVNGTYFPGSTRYDGVEAPLPHYPDSPTPYGKLSGSAGGEECSTETPAPTPTPTEAPTPTPTEAPTPTPTGTEIAATPTPTGTEIAATPTPTEEQSTPTPTGTDQAANGTPTPTPTGEELGVVGTPAATPPSTDLATTATGNDGAWRLVVAGIAGLMAIGLFLTASPRARRSR
jgi:hypothetical protein